MYTKVFRKILTSSVWLESHPTRIVFFTLLVSMDQDGFCEFASVRNLARTAIVTDDECQTAVAVLEAPDPDSSNPDHEGRRIERVPGGWMVLNHIVYRDMATSEHVRAQTRERVRRHRFVKGKLETVTNGNEPVTSVTLHGVTGNGPVTPSEADPRALSDLETGGTVRRGSAEPVWSQRRDRTRGLVGSHLRCHPDAFSACERSICVPSFLIDQWHGQLGGPNADSSKAIKAFVSDAIASLGSGPIGDEPLKLWRKLWELKHGAKITGQGNQGSKGSTTMESARKVADHLKAAKRKVK